MQFGPDKEWSVIFAVFDENRSWYITENMQNSRQNSSNTADPEFYNSNVIYSKFTSPTSFKTLLVKNNHQF